MIEFDQEIINTRVEIISRINTVTFNIGCGTGTESTLPYL